MTFLSVFAGVILVGVAIYYWYKWYKTVKGEEAQWFGKPAKPGEAGSLDEFVAAYRRGEVPAKDLAAAPAVTPSRAVAPPVSPIPKPVAIVSAAPIAPPVAVPPTVPVRRESFLSGAPKLGYLLCKSALRDHHVFAHVPLRALASGALDPRIAEVTVDLVICNAQLALVAAIDVAGMEAVPPDAAKVQALRSLGIRYLRLSAKSLPRPEQLKDLLYRM